MIFFRLKRLMNRFRLDESGLVTVEFVIIFPIFFAFFLMTVENGIISIRNVMLERGVDIAVREIRIGTMLDPTGPKLRREICKVAMIIPDCENQLQVELRIRDPRNWEPLPGRVNCINRSEPARPAHDFTHGASNQLVIIQACVRINPFLPTTGIGKAIVQRSEGNLAASGSYALVAISSYVVEPRGDDDEDDS